MSGPTSFQTMLYVASTGVVGSGIYLTWSYTGTATSYVISMTDSLGIITTIDTVSVNKFHTITTGLTDKETYKFSVKANNSGALSSASSETVTTYSTKIKYATINSTTATVSGVSAAADPTYEIVQSQVRIGTSTCSVTAISSSAFQGCTNLTNIFFPNSLTTIGTAAFDNCSSLKSIRMPDSVTVLTQMVFSGCTSLSRVKLSNATTTLGDRSFQGCTSLESIYIPKSVTTVTGGFVSCNSLTDVIIDAPFTSIRSDFFYGTNIKNIEIPDTVTVIEGLAFNACNNLESIIIPKAVTTINTTAFNALNLKDVYFLGKNIPTINTTSNFPQVSDTAYYFSDVVNDTKFTSLSTFFTNRVVLTNPINVKAILYVSSTGLSPSGINLTWDYRGGNITGYEVSIKNSTNVELQKISLTLGQDITETIIDPVFLNLPTGESYTFTVKVSIDNVLSAESPLSNSVLWNNNIKYSVSGLYAAVSGFTSGIVTGVISSRVQINTNKYYVTSIANDAFLDCATLTNITMHEFITTIGTRAFKGSGLTTVNIPSFVTSIRESAFDCLNLTSVTFTGDIPEIAVSNFTNLSDTAYYYPGVFNTNILSLFFNTMIEIIDTPTNVQSVLYTINSSSITGIFVSWKHSIAAVTSYEVYMYESNNPSQIVSSQTGISNATNSSIIPTASLTNGKTYIFKVKAVNSTKSSTLSQSSNETFFSDTLFYSYNSGTGFSNVHGIKAGTVTAIISPRIKIGTNAVSQVKGIGASSCANSTTLTTINIPSYISTIGNSAFLNCTKLEKINLQDVVSIGTSVFQGCVNLSSVILPKLIKKIPANFFYGSGLKRITLSNNITSIDTSAFQDCTRLVKINNIPASIVTIGDNVFRNCTSLRSIILPKSINSLGGASLMTCHSLENIELPTQITNLPMSLLEGCRSLKDVIVPSNITNVTVNALNAGFSNIYFLGDIPTILPTDTLTFRSQYDTAYYFNTPGNVSTSTNVTTLSTMVTKLVVLTYPINLKAILYAPTQGSLITGIHLSWDYKGIGITGYEVTIINSLNVEIAKLSLDTSLSVIIDSSRYTFIEGETYKFTVKVITDVLSLSSPESNSQLFTSNIKYSVTDSYYANVSGYNIGITSGTIMSKVRIDTNNYEVNKIGSSAFLNCSGLTNITIPETITIIDTNAFKGSGLTSVIIPTFVTNINDSAFDCSNLTSVTFSGEIPTIGLNNFTNTTPQKTVYYPTGIINSDALTTFFTTKTEILDIPTNIKSALYATTINVAITGIYVSWVEPIAVTTSYSVFVYNDETLVTTLNSTTPSIIVPAASLINETSYSFRVQSLNSNITNGVSLISTGTDTTTFFNNVIYTSQSLESGDATATQIIAGTVVATIVQFVRIGGYELSVRSIDSTFSAPSTTLNLTTVNILGNSLKNIAGSAFLNCKKLTTINIPDSVVAIGSMSFQGCTDLKSITLPKLIDTIPANLFYGSGITSISIPPLVKTIGTSAFQNCTGLTSIYIPPTVSVIPTSCFYGCSNITKIRIPSLVTLIKDSAFANCTKLKRIVLPYSLTTIEGQLFYACSNLRDITLFNSITSIGMNAFYNCTSLENLKLSNSITLVDNSGFIGCSNLQNIKLSNKMTTIKNSSFNGTSIKSIIIPSSVTSIETSAFSNNTELTSVIFLGDIPTIASTNFPTVLDTAYYFSTALNTSNLTTTPAIFANKVVLTYPVNVEAMLYIPDTGSSSEPTGIYVSWDYKGSGIQGYNITIININTNEIVGVVTTTDLTLSTVISSSFFSEGETYNFTVKVRNTDNSLSQESLSSTSQLWQGKIKYSINGLYASAAGFVNGIISGTILSEVKIGNNNYFVTSISASAFLNCSTLTSIIIPQSVVLVDSSAFSGCSGLTSITIPDNVSYIRNSAFNCSNLKDVYFLGDIPEMETTGNFPNVTDKAYYYAGAFNTNILPSLFNTITSRIDSPTNIQAQMSFPSSNAVTDGIYVSWLSPIADVTKYIVTGYDDLGNLIYTSEDILGTESSLLILSSNLINGKTYSFKVQAFNSNVGGGIQSDMSVSSDTITYYNEIRYSYISNTREASVSGVTAGTVNAIILKKVKISTYTNLLVTTIGMNAFFASNSTLKTIVIPSTVKTILSNAFTNCNNIINISIPNTVTSIGAQAFFGCTSLISLNIPNSVKTMGGDMFYNCRSLISINISNTLTTLEYGAFTNCVSLTDIVLPNSITSIGSTAFSGCTGLSNVIIPGSVTSIGIGAFYNCSTLLQVYFLGSIPTIDVDNFNASNDVGYYFASKATNKVRTKSPVIIMSFMAGHSLRSGSLLSGAWR
jgi:hypothetical protein